MEIFTFLGNFLLYEPMPTLSILQALHQHANPLHVICTLYRRAICTMPEQTDPIWSMLIFLLPR